MAEAHEILEAVQDTYKRVVSRLASLTGKTTEWYSSHAREPRKLNPLQSGNVSPVTHYMQFARQYEAAEKGAGRMLNNRVHAELDMEFAEVGEIDCSQKKFHAGILRESFDVLHCLNEYDFESEDLSVLKQAEEEAAQLRDEASDLVSHIRAIKKFREENKGSFTNAKSPQMGASVN